MGDMEVGGKNRKSEKRKKEQRKAERAKKKGLFGEASKLESRKWKKREKKCQ